MVESQLVTRSFFVVLVEQLGNKTGIRSVLFLFFFITLHVPFGGGSL